MKKEVYPLVEGGINLRNKSAPDLTGRGPAVVGIIADKIIEDCTVLLTTFFT